MRLQKENNWQDLSKRSDLIYKITGFFELDAPIPEIGWSEEFLSALSGLKPGETSELVTTERGFFIVRLLGVKEPYLPEFSQAKEKVIQALQKEKAAELSLAKAREYKTVMEEKIKNNPRADFKNMANELKLQAKETENFTRIQYLQGIGLSAEFLQSAFSLINQESKLALASSPQASYIIKLLQYLPADLGKFEKEKEGYRKKIEAKNKEEVFISFLQKLKEQARLKNNLTSAAKSLQ